MIFNLYVSDDCKYCHALKEKMDSNHVEYVLKNISKDRNAAKHLMKDLKVKSVPVVEDSNGRFLLGNNPEVDKFLGIAKS